VTEAITLGPVSLPVGPLVLILAFYVAAFAGRRAGRLPGANPETSLYLVFLLSLVAARIAFVVQFSEAYRQSPLGVFDLRDGGWTPAAGLLAGALATGWLAWRRKEVRRPLLVAGATAAVVWLTATLLPQAWRDEAPRLPEITLSDLSSRQVALESFAGRWW